MIFIAIAVLLVLMLAGVPIAFSLMISGCVGLWLVADWNTVMAILGSVPYRSTASYVLTVIPMFILLAEVTSRSGIAKELFTVANKWIGHVPGGVGIARSHAMRLVRSTAVAMRSKKGAQVLAPSQMRARTPPRRGRARARPAAQAAARRRPGQV